MENIIEDQNREIEKERWIIIMQPPWVTQVEILMALAGMDMPILVVAQEEYIKNGSIEELVAMKSEELVVMKSEELVVMKSEELVKLLLTIQEYPQEHILPPSPKINKNYQLPRTKKFSYDSKPQKKSKKSFNHRKR